MDDHSADLIVEQTPYEGAAAIELLKHEYIGSEANNAIASIMELIELTHKEGEGETLTEYGNRMIKLKKIISNYDFDLDKLVTVCGIRGLSDTFDLFKQVIKRGVWPTTEKLNQMMREEDSALLKRNSKGDSMLKANHIGDASQGQGKWQGQDRSPSFGRPYKSECNKSEIICFKCGEKGHVAVKCSVATSKKCKVCKRKNHNTADCWKGKNKGKSDNASVMSVQYSSNSAENQDDDLKSSFMFSVKHHSENVVKNPQLPDQKKQGVKAEIVSGVSSIGNFSKLNCLLVDTGATAHIINDVHKFSSFRESDTSEHVIELAEGTKTKGMVRGKGIATYT